MKRLLLLLCLLSTPTWALTLTTEEYPPLNFSPDNGVTVSGSSTDLMREIMRRSGLTGTISIYPWQRAFNMALSIKDGCVFSTTRTEAREQQFKWVGPLSTTHWVLFAKADSSIQAKTLEDLRPYTIGGYQGDAKALFLIEKGFKVDEAINEDQNFKKLNAGRISLWAAGSDNGPWYAKKLNIKIKPVLDFNEVRLYAACNPAIPDADIARMNEALKAIRADGTYNRIFKAYE
ncbi:MAG: ABC transporter substrate-binding protein [Betaproteobacteria bacterium]